MEFTLNNEEKKEILMVSRKTLNSYISDGVIPKFNFDNEKYKLKCGGFVTLNKDGNLRGCIGYIEPFKPLLETIIEMTINASTKDPRFSPVSSEELEKIKIDISILSPLEKIEDIDKIIVGKHGILIRKGRYSGVLLPQVATEWGWERKTFIEQTCNKAGLPIDSYKEGADIYIFSAQIFGEDKDN